jgi:hypothetical protein
MRIFKRKNGRRRYPKAHAAAFLDNCAHVADGPHGPEQVVIGADGERIVGACIEWQGPVSPNGYGKVWADGRHVSAHRHSWTLDRDNPPIPDAMQVLHRCDNRRCVLGEHLFLGTHDDNMRDMAAKGRAAAAGERNGNARLTDAQVAEIRRRYVRRVNGAELAAEFGVSLATVMNVMAGRAGRYRVATNGATEVS